jgi:CO/xanthine dehydrogenase Mo-binding subunit
LAELEQGGAEPVLPRAQDRHEPKDVPGFGAAFASANRRKPAQDRRHVGRPGGPDQGGMIVAPPAVVNAIEDALSPFGVRIYEQHLPPARILELIAAADSGH